MNWSQIAEVRFVDISSMVENSRKTVFLPTEFLTRNASFRNIMTIKSPQKWFGRDLPFLSAILFNMITK